MQRSNPVLFANNTLMDRYFASRLALSGASHTLALPKRDSQMANTN
jgi:hypothetical protein